MVLLAVHLSDGILSPVWWLGGFALAGLLLAFSLYRLHEDEIPRVALLTAAVFIASSIHVRVGPSSVHLLLGGIVGVVLGRRAAAAVFVGLVLQAFLLGHGGVTTLGVNTCVIALPALLCGLLFRVLHPRAELRHGVGRALLVAACAVLLCFGTLLCLLALREQLDPAEVDYERLADELLRPWVPIVGVVFVLAALLAERRLENAPEFPLGFLIGELAVLATVGLNALVLILGSEADVPVWVALTLVAAHLPIALVEGVILGVVVGFLARVKPSLLA